MYFYPFVFFANSPLRICLRYGSLPAFAELYILKSYRRKNVNDFFRTDRTALKRNFLHLNGKLRAALLRGLFCLNEKAEEAVAPPAEVYLNYHLCRMRIFPLPRIKRILFRPYAGRSLM